MEKVKQLLEQKADTEVKNSAGQTPLHVACEKGFTAGVRLLINQRANVDATDIYQNTPLHHISRIGNLECMELLVGKNADVEAKDCNGRTPLHLTCENGKNVDCVKFLLLKKANIEAQDRNGWTPLHVAGFHGNADCIQLLLKRGAEFGSIKTFKSETALDLALKKNHEECIELLDKYFYRY